MVAIVGINIAFPLFEALLLLFYVNLVNPTKTEPLDNRNYANL
jgi:hypothetical protein